MHGCVCFPILIRIYETSCTLSCYIDIITHSNSQVFLWEVNDVYVLSFLTEYIRIIMCYRATRIWWRTTSLMYSYENNKTHTSMQVFLFFSFSWKYMGDVVRYRTLPVYCSVCKVQRYYVVFILTEGISLIGHCNHQFPPLCLSSIYGSFVRSLYSD